MHLKPLFKSERKKGFHALSNGSGHKGDQQFEYLSSQYFAYLRRRTVLKICGTMSCHFQNIASPVSIEISLNASEFLRDRSGSGRRISTQLMGGVRCGVASLVDGTPLGHSSRTAIGLLRLKPSHEDLQRVDKTPEASIRFLR